MQNKDPQQDLQPGAQHNQAHHEPVDQVVHEALQGSVPRRDFLRRVVLLGLTSSAAYKLLDATNAQAQTTPSQNGRITTFAIGEEGNPSPAVKPAPNPPTYNPSQSATTFAVGEESKPKPTTTAFGEENTRPPTTYPSGEEQPYRPAPQTTTQAVGEEGRQVINPSTNRLGEESAVTTQTYGEESGGGSRPTTFSVGEESTPITRPTPSPTISTRAVGEEGTPITRPTPSPTISTRAVGEEGSRSLPQRSNSGNGLRGILRPWRNFRRW